MIRRVLRYQRGNQNPYIEEGQKTPKKEKQKIPHCRNISKNPVVNVRKR
jgi:hypothetical protein